MPTVPTATYLYWRDRASRPQPASAMHHLHDAPETLRRIAGAKKMVLPNGRVMSVHVPMVTRIAQRISRLFQAAKAVR